MWSGGDMIFFRFQISIVLHFRWSGYSPHGKGSGGDMGMWIFWTVWLITVLHGRRPRRERSASPVIFFHFISGRSTGSPIFISSSERSRRRTWSIMVITFILIPVQAWGTAATTVRVTFL